MHPFTGDPIILNSAVSHLGSAAACRGEGSSGYSSGLGIRRAGLFCSQSCLSKDCGIRLYVRESMTQSLTLASPLLSAP